MNDGDMRNLRTELQNRAQDFLFKMADKTPSENLKRLTDLLIEERLKTAK